MAEQYMTTSLTLPKNLVERLDRVATAEGKSRSALARDMLGFALDHNALHIEVGALRDEVGDLRERLARLESPDA